MNAVIAAARVQICAAGTSGPPARPLGTEPFGLSTLSLSGTRFPEGCGPLSHGPGNGYLGEPSLRGSAK
jgi:hypothetical protein